ncbi:MAG TPA: alpha-galactosidase [Vicinamibacterales bacterium]|nr:alpha-galactosidase [Vicinamibacterales bacterium]
MCAADRPPVVATVDDAFIAHQSNSDTWVIGGAALEVTIGFDASKTLAIQQMSNPLTGRAWPIAPATEPDVTVGGERVPLSSSGTTTLLSADASSTEYGVTLTFTFEQRSRGVRIRRSYACYPGSPTIETWTRVEATGGSIDVSNMLLWRLAMDNAHVRWLGGLRGDSADNEEAGAFELADRDLEPGERIDIGADRRSTEQFIPFVLVDAGRDEFFGGIMWSGSWQIAIERGDDQLKITAAIPNVATAATPSQPVELPHAFFGIAAHSISDESGALQQFILRGIRHGRPFHPLVTYNSWFAYGVRVDEDAMVAEIDRAAQLGVELFVLDAGWYLGAGANGDFDFDSGLGSWQVDSDRFPSTLASLSDYAHGSGIKFGLWVEPGRVALSTVDQPGLARQAWLATEGGEYGEPANAQICFVRPEAWQWVFDKLTSLIDYVRPDYIKWDNNLWINCDRSGHGHGASDGNFQDVRALYAMLAALRARYPDLIIENVSGGGNRIDFGMLQYTDVGWMDDRTGPSTHVRHNLEGLTFALPPAYLLSFVIDADGEPIAANSDLPLLVRSRMPGVLGLTYRTEEIYDDTVQAMIDEIARYKAIRNIIAGANATLLSSQAPVDDSSWDVMQELAPDAKSAVVFGFKASADPGNYIVRPRGLRGDLMYTVQSFDTGVMGSVRGDILMRDGIEFNHVGGMSRAHVIVLTAQ